MIEPYITGKRNRSVSKCEDCIKSDNGVQEKWCGGHCHMHDGKCELKNQNDEENAYLVSYLFTTNYSIHIHIFFKLVSNFNVFRLCSVMIQMHAIGVKPILTKTAIING